MTRTPINYMKLYNDRNRIIVTKSNLVETLGVWIKDVILNMIEENVKVCILQS